MLDTQANENALVVVREDTFLMQAVKTFYIEPSEHAGE